MAERIDIVIREDGSRQVKKNIKEVGDQAGISGKAVDQFKKALEFAGIGLTIAAFVSLAQEGIEVTNVLKNATESQNEFNAALKATQQTAINTGTDTKTLAELYDTLATAGKAFHATQEQTSSIVDTVAKAYAAEGKSAEEAGGAIKALSRSLLSGEADSRGFLTIINSSNLLAETMAAQFQETGGSVAKFIQVIKDGRVASKDFYLALLHSANTVGTAFDGTSRTLAQAFGSLHAALVALATDGENATGIMGAVAQSIFFVSQHLNALVPIVLAFAAAWVASMVRTSLATGLLKDAVELLNFAFKKNPFVAVLSVLIAVTAAVYEAYQNWAAFAAIVDQTAVGLGLMDKATASANASVRDHAASAHDAAIETQRLALTGQQAAVGLDQVKRAADGSAVALDSYGNVIEDVKIKHLSFIESVKRETEALGGTFNDVSSSASDASTNTVHFGDSINQVSVGLNEGIGNLGRFRGALDNVAEGYKQVQIAIAAVNWNPNSSSLSGLTGSGTKSVLTIDSPEDVLAQLKAGMLSGKSVIDVGDVYGPIGGLISRNYREGLQLFQQSLDEQATSGASKLTDTPVPTVNKAPQQEKWPTTINAPITIVATDAASFNRSTQQVQRDIAIGLSGAVNAR